MARPFLENIPSSNITKKDLGYVTKTQEVKFRPLRVLITLVVAGLLFWLLKGQVTEPINKVLSERYFNRGNHYFKELEFDKAVKEYTVSLRLDKNNQKANQYLIQAEGASTDIAQAETFFVDQKEDGVITKLKLARQDFANAKEALQQGVKFYTANDYVYARYPLEQSVQMDPEYPEAWHYLGLVYEQLAKYDASYRAKAEEAVNKRDSLTTSYLNLEK